MSPAAPRATISSMRISRRPGAARIRITTSPSRTSFRPSTCRLPTETSASRRSARPTARCGVAGRASATGRSRSLQPSSERRPQDVSPFAWWNDDRRIVKSPRITIGLCGRVGSLQRVNDGEGGPRPTLQVRSICWSEVGWALAHLQDRAAVNTSQPQRHQDTKNDTKRIILVKSFVSSWLRFIPAIRLEMWVRSRVGLGPPSESLLKTLYLSIPPMHRYLISR